MAGQDDQSSETRHSAQPSDINPGGCFALFENPSEEHTAKSMMGCSVRFGPGAEITRVSLPSDFSAIRIWDIQGKVTSELLFKRLSTLPRWNGHRRHMVSRRGTHDGVHYGDLAAEDPNFAQTICKGLSWVDEVDGTNVSDDVARIPSFVRWQHEPHVADNDARTVRLTWRAPSKTAMLVFKDPSKAGRMTQLFREGLFENMGGRVDSEPLTLTNYSFAVQVRALPLHLTHVDIRRQMPRDLKPDRIMCPPAMVYREKERAADLAAIKPRLEAIGRVTVVLRSQKVAEDGKVCAMARFDNEADARRAVEEHNNTVLPFVRGGALEVAHLYKSTFNVPREWVHNPANPLERMAKMYPKMTFRVAFDAGDIAGEIATVEMAGTNAKEATEIRRVFEAAFGCYHRRNEEEGRRPLDDCDAAAASEQECPVCMAEPTEPIRSACGHVYCKDCYVHLVQSTASLGRESSIKCIGEDGSCQAPFPLAELRSVFPTTRYRKILETVLTSHVRKNPLNLRSCPTPHCQQLYRPAPREAGVSAVARCPDCLVVMCTACHEAHDEGVSCKVVEDAANAELMRALNIKGCPRCGTFIERTEGCNHMECGCCHAHICWLCMADFPESLPCYEHMRDEHGGAYAGIPGYDPYGEPIDEDPDALLAGVEPQLERHFAQDFYGDGGDEDQEDAGEEEVREDDQERRDDGVLLRA
ncbi:hypothetical protein LZ30DRAFT_245438 [Colletotrichum cereale]|nr:hypothetical protein LZ30DRAFT_245438 [Colletotrichum cereale]